ncbi:MAG: hypothetical protein KF744_11590 [Taibaiella sp.]|nr:hypothetical protein [Taibaiella sp.]
MPVEKLTIPSDKKLDAILYLLVEMRVYQMNADKGELATDSGLNEDYKQDDYIKYLNEKYKD